MLRRFAVALALLVAIPAVAIPCWVATHRRDLPSAADGDLAVSRSEIAPGTNGFGDFVEASDLLDWPEEADGRIRAIRAGEPADPAWVAGMLARNARAMESLERGIAAPGFQLPPDLEDSEDRLVHALIRVQRLLKLSGARARIDRIGGDPDGAIARASLGLRAGRRVSGGEGVGLIAMMFASAYQAIALADLGAVVRASSSTRDEARSLIAELEAARWNRFDWTRMWAVEYGRFRAKLAGVGVGDLSGEAGDPMVWAWRLLPADYLWQPNRTLSALAAVYRERQRRAGLACREVYSAVSGYEEGRSLRVAKALLSPNLVGGLLVEIATPNFERFDLKRCHTETWFSLVQALVAVEAYRDERGDLPARLGDLVPRYLERVPVDHFTGAPLRYSRERQIVYSVGDDFTDAGGGDRPGPGDAAEPAVSLARPLSAFAAPPASPRTAVR